MCVHEQKSNAKFLFPPFIYLHMHLLVIHRSGIDIPQFLIKVMDHAPNQLLKQRKIIMSKIKLLMTKQCNEYFSTSSWIPDIIVSIAKASDFKALGKVVQEIRISTTTKTKLILVSNDHYCLCFNNALI